MVQASHHVRVGRVGRHLDLHLPPHLHLLAIDLRLKAVELAAEEQGPLDFLIAAGRERLPDDRVGIEHAGQFAAAVEAEVERAKRPKTAADHDLGAAAAQIVFAAVEQSVGHFGLGAAGIGHHDADDAGVGRNPAFVGIGPEAGVGKPDGPAVVVGQDRARRSRNRAWRRPVVRAGRARPAARAPAARRGSAKVRRAPADRNCETCGTSTCVLILAKNRRER